jgi:hypothetical protein
MTTLAVCPTRHNRGWVEDYNEDAGYWRDACPDCDRTGDDDTEAMAREDKGDREDHRRREETHG